ncbi:hypothetical protein V1524DRAFT_299165, partial [Lipomyces starkeyi]
MSVIGDLDNTESPARGLQALRQVAELYISSQHARKTSQISIQPASKRSKRTVRKSLLTTKTRVAVHKRGPMEQSDLMGVVRRPLSPD